jgi:Peptidase inhibitor family I36
MNSFLKKAALLAVGVVTAAAVVGPAEAALACSTGDACLYSAANFGGYHYETFYSQPNLGNVRYAGTQIPLYAGDHVPSNVSSLDNWDFEHPIAVYYNSGYRGPCFEIPTGGAERNFANRRLSNGLSANDDMNSFHFNRHC